MTKMKVKQQKVQKKCMTKRKLKFDDYKNCLEATQLDEPLASFLTTR